MYEIERRAFLWQIPLTAAAVMAAIPEVLQASGQNLTWDDFTARLSALAKELCASADYDEDEYVYRLGAAAIGTPAVPSTAKLGRFAELDPPVEFGPVYRGAPIMIIQWKLAPNAWLPPHNHPHYDVVSVGLEGEAVITHYDIDGAAPAFDSDASFIVRRTRETLIAPRRISPLTSSRDNIHTFQAGPKGARGIDINTRAGDDIGFSFLSISAKALDPDRATYQAKWIGQTPKA